MKLPVKDLSGNSQGELEVAFALPDGDKGGQAVHEVVVAQRAARRSGTACTKTVGEVAGTNKKPWRQKGTGRARAGSFASPLWRGGGVVFGPKPRDYRKKVTARARQLALRKALSERLRAGDVVVVEHLNLETHRTKAFRESLDKLEVRKTVLVVVSNLERNLALASRNLQRVEVTTPQELNTYQALWGDKLLFTREAFGKLEERLKA